MTNRHAPPPKRSTRSQPPRRIVRTLTEGRRTEVEYFAKRAAAFRDRVIVDFDSFHGSPMSLVERAVALAGQRQRTLRRGRAEAPFDEIWCVFDRDEHPYVDEAIALAATQPRVGGHARGQRLLAGEQAVNIGSPGCA